MEFKALVIDRDPKKMISHSKILEELGLDCISSKEEISILHLIENTKFDIILLEWAIAHLSVSDILEEIRKSPINSGARVVLIVENNKDSDTYVATDPGVDAVLFRPLNQPENLHRINELIASLNPVIED